MERTRVWSVTALLAGVLTHLGAGAAQAEPPAPAERPGAAMTQRAAGKDARTLGYSKLLQARGLLGQGDFDAAERLAREVAQMRLTYTASEDSPAKVLQDVQKARTDPDALLHAARSALKRNDYAQAERYAKMADGKGSMFTFPVWSDSPSKVLKDVEEARKKQPPRTTGTRPGSTGQAPRSSVPTDAEGLLKAARAALARKDYVQAEKYARLAERKGSILSFPPWSDTPEKVLAEIAQARKTSQVASVTAKKNGPAVPAPGREPADAEGLLKAARAALARKDYVQAQRYAKLADSKASMFTFPVWSDTPSKVLKDVEEAQARDRAVARVKEKDKDRVPPAVSTTGAARTGSVEQARALVKQARQALDAGKTDDAKKLTARAREMKAGLGFWEDNPEKLDNDIRRAEANRKGPQTSGPDKALVKNIPGVPRSKEEAKKQLDQGRKYLADGKLDEALQVAQRIKAQSSLSWGLFEDSPDRLQIDVNKARTRRDRDEADRLLVEGRKLYEKGDYEAASRLAYRSQKLHGTYSLLDLGDRPASLLADIQTAQARKRKTELPAALVRREPKRFDLPKDASTRPDEPKTQGTMVAAAPRPADGGAKKLQAQQMVAEAQRLQREGKLVDAHRKAVEAQALGVAFTPDEVSPDVVCQQVAAEARQRVEGLVRQAHESVAYSSGDMAVRQAQAQQKLGEARLLAAGLGQDTRMIDDKMVELRRLGDNRVVSQAAHQEPAAPVKNQGQVLIEKARLELNQGDTRMARRLCEEALAGNFGVNDEAVAVLRSVDTEEFNQNRLAANRAFDAAVSAYNRREHAQAAAMIGAIDVRLLSSDRQVRLREIGMTPEMRGGTGLAQAGDAGKPAGAPVVTSDALPPTGRPANTLTLTGGTSAAVGKATATDKPDGGRLDEFKQRQKILFDQKRKDGLDVQTAAGEKFRAGQHDAALEMLERYVSELSDNRDLDPAQIALLRRPVESRINQFKLLKSQKEMAAGIKASHDSAREMLGSLERREEMKQKNVQKLMKEFNERYQAGKYEEAEALAMRAKELDPDNGLATAAVYMARRQRDVNDYKGIKEAKEVSVLRSLNAADRSSAAPAGVIDSGIAYDNDRWAKAKNRKDLTGITLSGAKSEKEKAIERRLSTPVTINFENAPLKQVIDDLREYHGLNIVPDLPALQEAGVSLESPVTIKLDQVSLKSALNLILRQVKLTHVIKDEVLQITTEEHARGKMVAVTYPVADLVIPVENYGDLRNPTGVPTGVNSGETSYKYLAPTPMLGPYSMPTGKPVGSPTGSMLSGPSAEGSTDTTASPTLSKRGPSNTTEEQLIKLITGTVAPRSWSDMGGPGTIEYFPLTMALVINQAPDIQEQISDLLAALRRLQDQEVAVEVRFISVNEDFFERIGVNFNLNLITNSKKYQPALNTNSFSVNPFLFNNQFQPGNALLGLTPAGTLTPTLNIPITQNSFYSTIPNFGGYAANGLTMGLAFLSDIQVFLFMEAAQGDLRSNTMQAPKLTLFNGQTATITALSQQAFVSGVQVAQVAGGNFVLVPQVAPQNFGVRLTIQAVISADRRFVRMSLAPTITNLVTGRVEVFPIAFPVFPFYTSLEGNQSGQPVVFAQYIQRPLTSVVNLLTTVAVPDGGTVLLGGLKQMSESRSEFGPPILSKIPYLSRLFKNVGYGRETDSLLIMVTPRIIVQEEEEERATGFISNPPGGLLGR